MGVRSRVGHGRLTEVFVRSVTSERAYTNCPSMNECNFKKKPETIAFVNEEIRASIWCLIDPAVAPSLYGNRRGEPSTI